LSRGGGPVLASPWGATRAPASSAMLTTSCERAPDAVATKPTPQASCSRPGSSAAAAGTAAWRWGRLVEREPAGGILCPGAAMVPPAGGAPAAGEAGIGAQKRPAPFESGPGDRYIRARLPGRSPGADEIKENGDRKRAGQRHECIIMHYAVSVKRVSPLDSSACRALA